MAGLARVVFPFLLIACLTTSLLLSLGFAGLTGRPFGGDSLFFLAKGEGWSFEAYADKSAVNLTAPRVVWDNYLPLGPLVALVWFKAFWFMPPEFSFGLLLVVLSCVVVPFVLVKLDSSRLAAVLWLDSGACAYWLVSGNLARLLITVFLLLVLWRRGWFEHLVLLAAALATHYFGLFPSHDNGRKCPLSPQGAIAN